MKGLRITKIFKETKFDGVWGELESKIFETRDHQSGNIFSETIIQKIFETKPSFHVK